MAANPQHCSRPNRQRLARRTGPVATWVLVAAAGEGKVGCTVVEGGDGSQVLLEGGATYSDCTEQT
eukprot:gene15261-30443_t